MHATQTVPVLMTKMVLFCFLRSYVLVGHRFGFLPMVFHSRASGCKL